MKEKSVKAQKTEKVHKVMTLLIQELNLAG
jgi:hypothetical protein